MALKNKWPPGHSVAATLYFHAQAFEQAAVSEPTTKWS
jgi:hypothetical protein